jgi:hypothetical protein
MSYKKFKSQQEVEAVDINTMADMSAADYKKYLDGVFSLSIIMMYSDRNRLVILLPLRKLNSKSLLPI